MTSADSSLRIIAEARKLLPKADLDRALEDATSRGTTFEQALRERGIADATIETCIKVRAKHGYPCEKCSRVTYLLPGETREKKPCEHCGGKLAAAKPVVPAASARPQAPPPTPRPAAPPPAAPSPAAPPPAAPSPAAPPRTAPRPTAPAEKAKASGAAPPPGAVAAAAKTPPEIRVAPAATPRRAATFAPPPAPAPLRPVTARPEPGFSVPPWAFTVLFVAVIWIIEGFGPFSGSSAPDTDKLVPDRMEWPVGEDTAVEARFEPAPPRPGKAKLIARVLHVGDAFEGEVSYRFLRSGDEPWSTLDADADHDEKLGRASVSTYSAERVLASGPAHLQLRVSPPGQEEGTVLDWELSVRDPRRAIRLPFWARWAIITLVLLYGVAPIVVKLTLKNPARIDFMSVDNAALPYPVAAYFGPRMPALEGLGFERTGTLAFDTGKNRFYLERLIDRAQGVTALVSVLVDSNLTVKAKAVGFTTRFVTGGAVETGNSTIFSELYPRAAGQRVANVREESLDVLYRIHQAFVAEVARGARKTLPEPGREIEQLAEAIVQPVAYAATQGYFALDGRANVFRPTFFGAFVMTWKMLPPLKQIANARRAKEEARLRALANRG